MAKRGPELGLLKPLAPVRPSCPCLRTVLNMGEKQLPTGFQASELETEQFQPNSWVGLSNFCHLSL